jgi:sarcosine oxidase
MAAHRETVVVGGGAMGSATAWHLARRGRQVTLIERFGARHTMGASHGRSRNFNITYADATYQTMLREAAGLWRELEDESGVSVLDVVGITNHGAGVAPDLAEHLGAFGVRATMLTPAEAQERWAGIRFDTRVLFCPGGGRLDAEEAVAALQSETARLGGEVLLDTRVDSIQVRADDRVEVVTCDEVFAADTVVVTAGAWTEKLLGSRLSLPRLAVTQEQPAHFAVSDPTAVWPSWNHLPEAGNLAPLCRHHPSRLAALAPQCEHRLKTHAGWRYTVLEPGTYLWSDPHGQQFLRDADGTRDVTQ